LLFSKKWMSIYARFRQNRVLWSQNGVRLPLYKRGVFSAHEKIEFACFLSLLHGFCLRQFCSRLVRLPVEVQVDPDFQIDFVLFLKNLADFDIILHSLNIADMGMNIDSLNSRQINAGVRRLRNPQNQSGSKNEAGHNMSVHSHNISISMKLYCITDG